MGVLDTVLRYKAEREAQKNADISAIPQAMMQFQAGRQQATDNLLKSLTLQATLATKGLSLTQNPQGGYSLGRDNSLLSTTDLLKQQHVESQIDLNKSKTKIAENQANQGSKVEQMIQDALSGNVMPGTQIHYGPKGTSLNVPVNPKLTQDQNDAVAAVNYMKPRYEKINTLVNSGTLDDNKFTKLAKEITVDKNGQLLVPDGSPLEELVGLVNDVKLTGFSLGGKNLTEGEKQVVYSSLNPTGKSRKEYLRGLKSLPEYFQQRINSATGGMQGALKAGSTSSDGYEYKTVNGVTMRRKIANG